MSSLQDFAQMKLAPPGDLQPQAPAPAPAPVPAPVPAPPVVDPNTVPMPADVPMVQPTQMAATPAEINAGANAIEPPASSLHGPHAIIRAEEKDERQADIDSNRAFAEQKQAAQANEKVQSDQAAAMQPLLNEHTRDLVEHQQAVQNEYAQMHAVGQKAATDYSAQIQALSDKMANQPKDMFGRAGVNKVEGIIGLILGGLGGSATGGKNMAVERLNQLTDQKLAQEKYEYEMLGKKADMSQNLYAQLRNQGLDEIAAHNAASVAKTDALISRMKATENSFVPSKAKNDLANTIATLDQQRTNFLQQGSQHRYGQAMQAYALEQKDRELAQQREEYVAKLGATKPEVYDNNPIETDFRAPSAEFAQRNRIIMPRIYETNSDLKLLKEKYEEFKRSHDSEEKGVLRDELASIAAQIETGIPNPAEPQIEAAKRRMGVDTILGVQRGRFNSTGWENQMVGKYIRAAFHSHHKNVTTAGFIPNQDGEYMRMMRDLDKEPETLLGEQQNKTEAALDRHKKAQNSTGRGVMSNENSNGYVNN